MRGTYNVKVHVVSHTLKNEFSTIMFLCKQSKTVTGGIKKCLLLRCAEKALGGRGGRQAGAVGANSGSARRRVCRTVGSTLGQSAPDARRPRAPHAQRLALPTPRPAAPTSSLANSDPSVNTLPLRTNRDLTSA